MKLITLRHFYQPVLLAFLVVAGERVNLAQTLTPSHAALEGKLSSTTPVFLFNSGSWLPLTKDFPFVGQVGIGVRPNISYTNTLLDITANGSAVLTVTNCGWNSISMLGDPTSPGSASMNAYLLSSLDFEFIWGGQSVFETTLQDFPTLQFTDTVGTIPPYGFSPGVTLTAFASATGYTNSATKDLEAIPVVGQVLTALGFSLVAWVNIEDTLSQTVMANGITVSDGNSHFPDEVDTILFNGGTGSEYVCGCGTNDVSILETWSDTVNLTMGMDVGCTLKLQIPALVTTIGVNVTLDLKDFNHGQPVTLGKVSQNLQVSSAPTNFEFEVPSFTVSATSVNPPGEVTPANATVCMGLCQTFTAFTNLECVDYWMVGNTIVQYGGSSYTLCGVESNTAVTLVYTNCTVLPPHQGPPLVINRTPAYCTNCPCTNACSYCTNCPSSGNVNAGVNPNGSPTGFWVQYGKTPGYGHPHPPPVDAGAGTNEVDENFYLSELSPNTTYHFQLVASNAFGFTYGEDQVFTTPISPPVVYGAAPASITARTAQLSGDVYPYGLLTTTWFEWWRAPANTNVVAVVQTLPNPPILLDGNYSDNGISADLRNLFPSATYYVRLVASNSAGTVRGQTWSFVTSNSPLPGVETSADTGVAATTATLGGSVDPQGLPATYSFQWGALGPIGTAFTYQGLLNYQGSLASNGLYTMSFAVWNAVAGGTELTAPLTFFNVGVTNGLFAVPMDFGPGAFTGNSNWLQVAVAPNGGGLGVLSPRQPLTPTGGGPMTGFGYSLTGAFQPVLNGGFETGDFSDWTQSGNTTDTDVNTNASYAHSGRYGGQLGPQLSLGYLSQTVTTSPGLAYLLSLWLDCPTGQNPNEFLVQWDGNTIFDQTNIPAIGWSNLLFIVTASGTNTVLQFGFRDDPSWLGLDDVSLQPITLNSTTKYAVGDGTTSVPVSEFLTGLVPNATYYFRLVASNPAGTNFGSVQALTTTTPEPPVMAPTLSLSANGAQGLLIGSPGLSYVVQVSTDLTHWATLTSVALTNNVGLFSDPSAPNFNRRFYRGMLP